MDSDVVVVGSGIIGLTTALTLARRGHRVRVWTRDAAADTTSAVAGALWWPYRIEPVERAGAWSVESLEQYVRLAGRPRETGVRLVAGVQRGVRPETLGDWSREVAGLRAAREEECPGGGLWARLPLIDMPVHLRWLRDRLDEAGGSVEHREVRSLAEAAEQAPVVVNCTGLGARELVPDPEVRPVRGQLVLVENPGIDTWYVAADARSRETTYFFPQPGRLVLGGTAEDDVWSTEPDPAVAAAIVGRCAAIRPEIAGARVLGHRVGLRPARPAVRLTAERRPDGSLLVHHYGHGGAGVTVAWGCARQAAELVARAG